MPSKEMLSKVVFSYFNLWEHIFSMTFNAPTFKFRKKANMVACIFFKASDIEINKSY